MRQKIENMIRHNCDSSDEEIVDYLMKLDAGIKDCSYFVYKGFQFTLLRNVKLIIKTQKVDKHLPHIQLFPKKSENVEITDDFI